jgi:hypothetical protein
VDGIEHETAHGVRPADDELARNRSFDESEHMRIVARIDRGWIYDIWYGLGSFVVGRDDDDRVNVAL